MPACEGSSAAGPDCGRAQALRHGAVAALWQRALSDITPPPMSLDGAGARDRLAYAVATALGDLFVYRGDDAVAAAVLLVALDPRGAAWCGATVHGSRPLRVAAAAGYLVERIMFCSCSCVGVSAGGGPAHPPPASCPRPRCSPRPRNGPFTRRAAADPARQSAPLHLA